MLEGRWEGKEFFLGMLIEDIKIERPIRQLNTVSK